MNVMWDDTYGLSGINFDTTRKAAVVAEALAANPIDGVTVRTPAPTTPIIAAPSMVHTLAYVTAVQTGSPRHKAESNLFDWDPGVYTMATAHVDGMVAAAHQALAGNTAGSLSSGFHHARPNMGAGYCTFNGLAVAVASLTRHTPNMFDRPPRIVVFDVDAHHGGGTHACVGNFDNVTLVDVSTNLYDRYLPDDRHHVTHTTQRGYLDAVRTAIDVVTAAEPDVVLYNAGMDPADDGVSNTVLELREQLVAGTLADAGIPVAWCLAGGYTNRARTMDEVAAQHLFTVTAFADPPVR